MTDLDMAVNWIRSQGWSEENLPSDEFGQMFQAFLAGLKAGKEEAKGIIKDLIQFQPYIDKEMIFHSIGNEWKISVLKAREFLSSSEKSEQVR